MRRAPVALLALAACASLALAQGDSDPSRWFPLDVGRSWTYVLEVKAQQKTMRIEYTISAVRTEEVAGAGTCVVFETASDQKLMEVEWFSRQGDKVVTPKRKLGAREATYTSPRVLVSGEAIAKLLEKGEGTSWPWALPDGAQGTVTLERRETIDVSRTLKGVECVVVVIRGSFNVGGTPRHEIRTIWLGSGIGVVKQTTEITKGEGELLLSSEATLVRHDEPQ